jgi:hypothetical protein
MFYAKASQGFALVQPLHFYCANVCKKDGQVIFVGIEKVDSIIARGKICFKKGAGELNPPAPLFIISVLTF